MKKLKIFFFLTFFFFFSFNLGVLNVLYVNADASIPEADIIPGTQEYTWEWAHIDYTWLDVQIGAFHDNSPGDGDGRFQVSKGGYKLDSFKNEGLISAVDNIVVYRSSAIFSYQMNHYTFTDMLNHFPYANLDEKESAIYLKMKVFDACWNVEDTTPIFYAIDYRTVNFGSKFLTHDYNGYTPITVKIKEDFQEREIIINGITFKNPQIESEVKFIEVVETRSGECGTYQDIYTGQSIKEGSVSTEKIGKQEPVLVGALDAQVLQKINQINLGWSYGQSYSGLTKQQSLLRAEPKGATFKNRDIGASYSFNLPIQVKPGITYSKQNIDVRYAELWWDNVDTFIISPAAFGIVEGPISKTQTRVNSVHIHNQFIHQEFKVHVNFIATAELIPEEGGIDLDDPYLEEGDYVWDETTEGTTDVEIVYTSPWSDLLDNVIQFGLPILIIIIVITIALFVLYKFGDKLLLIYTLKKKR